MKDKDKHHPIKTTMIEDTFELTMGSIRIKKKQRTGCVMVYLYVERNAV